MSEWMLRQLHDEDVATALEQSGSLNKSRQITQFRGKEYHEILQELGHTSMDFEKCECRKIYKP